jgi:hypothetical protein
MLGLKQEQKEEIRPKYWTLANVLRIPAEAIKNFDTEQAIHNTNNTFHDHSGQNQFNALEKIIELYEVKMI